MAKAASRRPAGIVTIQKLLFPLDLQLLVSSAPTADFVFRQTDVEPTATVRLLQFELGVFRCSLCRLNVV